jgi:sigma-B regulation protein RsbU (phosphoserine phosphatase)
VGAFAEVEYGQSSICLESGDLLALVTDGVTEPENEFGEMFGDERLNDLLLKNAHRSEQQIVEVVLQAIRNWTASDELQDDITLMVVRRV